MNIVLITSNSIRHRYFKTMFANSSKINVVKTFVETSEEFEADYLKGTQLDDISNLHFLARHNTECDYFLDVIENVPDRSNSHYINKGTINDDCIIDEICSINPNLIITYGCSIIKPKLINLFRNRILNVHLGLSPYYYGSGTNFHALVNNELHFFGYTFMYMDEGIDTGQIIHQSRADIFMFDNPHQIGNRLIKKMVHDFIMLVENKGLITKKDLPVGIEGKTYKRKDATVETIEKLYANFQNNSVLNYLKLKTELEKKFPLIEQDFLKY